jgi:hypothetical protein
VYWGKKSTGEFYDGFRTAEAATGAKQVQQEPAESSVRGSELKEAELSKKE